MSKKKVNKVDTGINKGKIEKPETNYPEEVLAILALKDATLEYKKEEIQKILETYKKDDVFDTIEIRKNMFLLLGFKQYAILDRNDRNTINFNCSHTVEGFHNLLVLEDTENKLIIFLNTDLKRIDRWNIVKSYKKVKGFDNLLEITNEYDKISFLNTELKSSISFERNKTSYEKVEGFDNLLKIEDNYNNSISFLNTELESSISFERDKTSYEKVEGFDNLLKIEGKKNNTIGVDTYFLNADLEGIDFFKDKISYKKVGGIDNLLEITKIDSGEKKLFNKDLKRTGRIYYDHYKDGYLYSPAGTRKKINLETMEIDDYWQLDENTNK